MHAHDTHLSVYAVFQSWLSCVGVHLVLNGWRKLGSKGIVECHCVVEVPKFASISLLLPLTYVYI